MSGRRLGLGYIGDATLDLTPQSLSLSLSLQVDAQEHQALAGMFGVTGYPTLKWMPKGKSLPGDAEVVKAPRTADGLEDYVNEKIGATSKKASVRRVAGVST